MELNRVEDALLGAHRHTQTYTHKHEDNLNENCKIMGKTDPFHHLLSPSETSSSENVSQPTELTAGSHCWR